jgi:hypothetical protein
MSAPARPPSCYRIRIRGHLLQAWSAWFDSLVIAPADDGTTELVGPLVDQAALFGVLARLRDLGATLLLVEQLTAKPSQRHTPEVSDPGGRHVRPGGRPGTPRERAGQWEQGLSRGRRR